MVVVILVAKLILYLLAGYGLVSAVSDLANWLDDGYRW